MLEKMLSKWGFRLHMAIAIPLLAYLGWGTFTDTGIPAWLNHLQAEFFDGSYYPKLTFVLLIFPTLAISFPTAYFFDYMTGQGVFERKKNDRFL